MIFIIDDDIAFTETTGEILSAEGYNVLTFNDATSALEKAVAEEPELILSDIVMPEIAGFEFKEAYSLRFPNRSTPFVFLTSLSDTGSIVRGLDLGADDYLTKPITSDVLKAKVRSVLNRKKRYSVPVFHGDLSKLPFVQLLQFCELKGLTGEIELSGVQGLIKIPMKGGSLLLDKIDDTLLEQLYDRSEGTFIIYAHPVDFREIEEAGAVKAPAPASSPPLTDKDRPMGKLSGVQVNSKLFQVQTEFITYPDNQVVTIVILDGKVMTTRKALVPPEKIEKKHLEKIIEQQHGAVENEVREKINDLIKKKSEDKGPSKERFTLLFEQGYDAYWEGNYAEALALWEEAHSLNLDDKILETNLGILRKKRMKDL